MSDETLRAFVVRKQDDGSTRTSLEQVRLGDLPPGEVLFRVQYSSLNYKDALSVSGNPGVTKNYPHIPGIDAAGVVVSSTSPAVRPGQEIIVTSYELGANRWGGYAELCRVPADWVVPLPAGLSLRESMILGTAGFTAAQCVQTLMDHQVQPSEEVVVTGATGGVGSLAVMMLSRLGYRVVAISGKAAQTAALQRWGAHEVLPREAVDDRTARPLLSSRFAGAVDTIGGNTLATILRSTRLHGCVTACGLIGGTDLHTTVFPFILRGVSLCGITSAWCPKERRLMLWDKLAGPWKPELELLATQIGLEQVSDSVAKMFAGQVVGRLLVKVSAD